MQTSSSSSRPSRRGNRMHLLQLAETMAKQFRHRQRQDMFSKWKLFVVMKAVGILVQSAAFLSPAQLLSTSTNGGGPLPLTLLIKAGKRATIKKRVVSTTRIFRSSISEVGGTTSTSSAALGQLAHQTLQFNGASPTTSTAVVKPLPLISSTAAVSTLVDALLVPSCMKPNVSGPTTSSPAQQPSTPPMATSPRGSRTSPTLDLTSTPTTSAANAGDGLADFLSGIGACGAINSPVSASDMSLASLVKEVQLLRATVEAQKRTIDMRDRYINELVRRQDTDLSLRDIERDHVLQQAVSKLESSRLTQQQRSRAGSRVLVGAASPLSSVPAVATSPSSAPLSPPFPQPPAATTAAPPPPPSSSGGAFHHQTLSQATQTLQQLDASISSSFDAAKTVIPMPPVSPVDSNAAGSGIATTTTTGAASSMRLPARSNVTSGGPSQNRSSSNINNNKKRNSVDNAMLLQQQQQSSSTSSTPRGAGEQTVDETPTTMSVSNVVAGMSHNATGRALHQRSSLTSSHPASSMSSSSAASQQQQQLSHSATQKKGDHNPSASPMVVLAAQPQMVSLSISSMLRPAVAHPQQQPHHHVNPPPDHQSATDFVLLSARGVINNANHSGGGGGGSTSQPTSSRKVHALRGTSLLPILSQQQQQQQQALLQGSSTVVGNSSTTTTAAAAKGSSSSQPSAAAQQGK